MDDGVLMRSELTSATSLQSVSKYKVHNGKDRDNERRFTTAEGSKWPEENLNHDHPVMPGVRNVKIFSVAAVVAAAAAMGKRGE